MAKDTSHSSSKLHADLLNFVDVCAAMSVRVRLCVYSGISECKSFCISDLYMTLQWDEYTQIFSFACVYMLGIGHTCVCTYCLYVSVAGVRVPGSCMQEGVLMIA